MSELWRELDTPAVLVDLDVLDRNMQHKARLAEQAGVKLRPHFKTHKNVWIAKEQLRYGAGGITVAKLGEAEVLADAGIRDILIAFPLIGAKKLARLAKLMERAEPIVSIDSVEAAEGLSELAAAIKRPIRLYIDVNTGLNRCGKEPGDETAALVKDIVRLSGLEVVGLMTHGGYAYTRKNVDELRAAAVVEAAGLVETKRLLAASGIDVPVISVGSTPTSKFIGELEGVNEMRPGAYVYGDRSQLTIGSIAADECAMHILATVVSTPRAGTAIIDAGSKTFSSDGLSNGVGFGTLRDHPDVYVERLSEEHGIVKLPDGFSCKIGDRLVILPNHCCTISNLHNELHGIRGEYAERTLTVDARGRIR